MTKDFCDRCGKELEDLHYRLSIEVSPAKFHRKNRDYCEKCFNEVAGKLDERLA